MPLVIDPGTPCPIPMCATKGLVDDVPICGTALARVQERQREAKQNTQRKRARNNASTNLRPHCRIAGPRPKHRFLSYPHCALPNHDSPIRALRCVFTSAQDINDQSCKKSMTKIAAKRKLCHRPASHRMRAHAIAHGRCFSSPDVQSLFRRRVRRWARRAPGSLRRSRRLRLWWRRGRGRIARGPAGPCAACSPPAVARAPS